MIGKLIVLLSTFVFAVSGGDVFAVSSVRQLGTLNTASDTAAKPVSVTPQQPSTERKASTLQAKVAKISADSDNTARIPSISTIKTISKPVITPGSGGGSGSSHVVVEGGVSEERFMQAVDRLSAIEQKVENAVTDVTESGNGNYISNVSRTGNAVTINKTRLLYAPVRNNGSETVVSDAEIWLVK